VGHRPGVGLPGVPVVADAGSPTALLAAVRYALGVAPLAAAA